MDQTVVETVLSEIADREGVSPEQLDPPLYDAIDPESLETVFRNTSGSVSFEYCGYTVTVTDGGTVDVEPNQLP